MSDKLNLEEEVSSPDLFSDSDPGLNESNVFSFNKEEELVSNEANTSNSSPEWKGVSLDEIYKGRRPFEFQELPQIHSSASHTVLFALPIPDHGVPKAYPANAIDKWCTGFVRMPHSTHSLYSIEKEGKKKELRCRWEIIQEALLQSFTSSFQLEAAIFSYNDKYAQRWNFSALHHFFSEVVDEDESEAFFTGLLPKIIALALQLPTLITGAIPLLKRHTNASISLSQIQVASLLANAFLCTFPRRNSTNPQSEYANYPHINFNKLFSAFKENRQDKCSSVSEKLKCIFHYFRRVTTKAPEGTITIQRKYIAKEECPRWDRQSEKLPLLHIASNGTIETEGAGLLQVDFANMYVGGGVLGWGCVQEEIRFVICPELFVTMLVTEVLDDTEALVISGVERFSKYEGYSSSFKWIGDFVDETPRDNSGRRKTSVVAIDALFFKQPSSQFKMSNVIRELNKAYIGFKSNITQKENVPAVATGNWGCGVFHGNPQLKVLLQLMAAASAGRNVVYFTFGDAELRDSVSDMYWHLVQQNIDIGQLFSLLSQYQESMSRSDRDFYRFLYNRSKMKPITNYFKKLNTHVKNVKTPEKRKRENSLTSPEQNEKINDEIIAKWIENEDAKLKIIKINSKEENEIINNDSEGKKIDFPSRNNSNETKVEKIIKKPNCNQDSDTNKTTSSSSSSSSSPIKKKLSLWDLPMYEDSKKSNKNSESISELHNSNEENQLEIINVKKLDDKTIPSVKNEMKKSKLEEIVATSTKKTLGQRKISDFFL
ncbi:poly(ADP-ribose) glycohydrolase [Leptopilina heterotoma]|uniref:poly(ADP-ribose) glycohydrolase n=1 Tax=Leptopilina heterotoma TaxID=63436 RepID=UPI001CA94628|nr:poly(ADP-ribose) glycohydrolase [Leptopilina heterotoma]